MTAAGRALRVLCLDHEGGHGGSSRSLYHLLAPIDRARIAPVVWCRQASPLLDRYAALGIPCRVDPAIVSASSRVGWRANLSQYRHYGRAWMAVRRHWRDLAAGLAAEFDLIHANHENLYQLAGFLARRSGLPLCGHVRTMVWLNTPVFARYQARRLAGAAAGLVFITENEQAAFSRLAAPRRQRVIHNVAEPLPEGITPWPGLAPPDGRLRVACLSNFGLTRGLDRLAELAARLKAAGAEGAVEFIVAGDMTMPRDLPGALGEAARTGRNFAGHVQDLGLGGQFVFLGHVDRPEAVLAACDLLIKPTREANPWGRDILEALAAGRPVISVGTYDRFVQDGVTGFLQADFDAGALATRLRQLAADRSMLAEMGRQGAERIARLCNGPARAADLAEFWIDCARGPS